MCLKRVSLMVIIVAVFKGYTMETFGLVEMISDYAKVVKNTEKITTQATNNNSILTTESPKATTEPTIDYQDFDDLQEEDRSLKQSSSADTMIKYFNGLVSLLTFMYKFNGSFGEIKAPKVNSENKNEPRGKNIAKEVNRLQDTGKQYHQAQDRFEFPQKKFRYHENMNDNTIDQQYQPVENYPPYNPLQANNADTYEHDDKKTSYDVDLTQYDLIKNSVKDFNPDVDIQQSYSFEIPYENPKSTKTSPHDLTKDNGMSWYNPNIYPVYHPWMAQNPTQDKPTNDDYQQGWKTKSPVEETPVDSYKPWKNKVSESKPHAGDSEPLQPWNDKPNDFPTYHHDFKDTPPTDHHFQYHEIEHPVDEDRVSKKPYSYYFLGRKLWYIPLLFSVYFIIYIGALVLKSVARHKIQFPEKIWNLHDDHFVHGKHRKHRKVDDLTENYEKAVEKMSNKFM